MATKKKPGSRSTKPGKKSSRAAKDTPKRKPATNSAPRRRYSVESVEDAARSCAVPEKLLKHLDAASKTPEETWEEVGVKCPSTYIPDHGPDGKLTGTGTYRLHRKSSPKYKRKKGTRSRINFIPGPRWLAVCKDTLQDIYFVEGSKKGACLAEYGRNVAAMDGCHNHQSKNKNLLILPEIEEIDWRNRRVVLVPDSDYYTNEQVQRGFLSLASKLKARDARVYIVVPPLLDDEGGKTGLDDYLLKHSIEEFDALSHYEFDRKAQVDAMRREKGNVHDKRQKIADLILSDMTERGTFYQNSVGETYYMDESEHCSYNMSDPKLGEFRAYLNEYYGLNGTEAEYAFVHEHLRSHAQRNGPTIDPSPFTYYDTKTNRLYINAGDNRVFRISERGYELTHNGVDGVLFAGFSIDPIEPDRTGSRAELAEVHAAANFGGSSHITPKQERMLFELWCWYTLFPEHAATRAHLLMVGEKGSYKTSALRKLLRFYFGARADVHALDPKKEDAAVTLFTTIPLVAIDNVDGRIPWLDNLLASLATGGTVPRRKLYTTNELVDFPLRTFVCATSRDAQSFARDDVADRTLILHVQRGKSFVAEKKLDRRMIEIRPKAWGAALKLLPKILSALRKQKPQSVAYRMADFAEFALAVGPVLGYSRKQVTSALDAAQRVRGDFVLEHSPLRASIQYWLESSTASVGKEISVGDLYKEVMHAWPDSRFPFRRPQDFGNALRNQLPELRNEYGIKEREGRSRQRFYTFSPLDGKQRRKYKG